MKIIKFKIYSKINKGKMKDITKMAWMKLIMKNPLKNINFKVILIFRIIKIKNNYNKMKQNSKFFLNNPIMN